MVNGSLLLDWLVALGLFAGLLASLEIWYRFGLRARARQAEHPDQLSTIQGATLGLLALLLGFSFALAAGRFSDRTKMIVDEANAIGTAWLRCDLVDDAQRTEIRELLRRYVTQRIAIYDAPNETARAASVAESESLQTKMWTLMVRATKATPEFSEVLLPPFNELIDLHGTRMAAATRHMPGMLMALLLACSFVSVASVGYGCGVAGKRNVVLTTALTFLISGALWATIDMDHPRRGLIRVGQQPMLDLQSSLERSSTPVTAKPTK